MRTIFTGSSRLGVAALDVPSYPSTMSASKVETKGYFNLPGPVQGLTVAISGIKIISCIAEKINQVRGRVNGVVKDGNNNCNNNKEQEKESLFTLVLGTFCDLKGRFMQVRIFSSTTEAPQSDDSNAHGSLTHSVSDSVISRRCQPKTKLRRSCSYSHHMDISSWKHAKSIHKTHVPHNLREPFIEHGYFLPYMPWSYYLKGLYTPSYELMNVWTHLIPSIFFFYLLYAFSQEVSLYTGWPLFVLTFCAAAMTGTSAMAHLFHSRSSLHHSCCFMADYFGISIYALASLLSNFYSGSELEYYKWLSGYYLPIALVIAMTGYSCLCLTQTGTRFASLRIARQMKVYVNALGYGFGFLPIFLRVCESTSLGEMDMALWCHTVALTCLLIAPVVYGCDFPQRLCPGKFDVFGHSHMCFHILTAMGGYYDICAVYHDVKNGPWKILHQQDDYPTVARVTMVYAILLLYGIIVGCLTKHIIKDDHAHEQPLLQGEVLCECGLPETARYHCKEE